MHEQCHIVALYVLYDSIDQVTDSGLEVDRMIPHRIMNGSIVIHDAASATIENLHFAVGQENTLEVVIPLVQFLVELG